MTNLSHKKLVRIGAKWLGRTHVVVSTEIGLMTSEEPDVLGFDREGRSTLIEVKASRSDFLADAKKKFREPGLGVGHARYYLCPFGMIKAADVPDSWGLLWYDTGFKRVSVIVLARRVTPDLETERRLLPSLIRRLGKGPSRAVSVQCYTHETLNTATVSIGQEVEIAEDAA